MGLISLALLPARAAVATAEVVVAMRDLASPTGPVRRPGGYGERLDILLAEDGALEQLGRLGDPEGPLARIEQLALLTADDRPLGRVLAPGGPLDRLLAQEGVIDRLMADGGTLDRLLFPGGPLDRLLAEDGPLDRLLAPDGPVDRVLAEGGAVSQIGDLSETLGRLADLEESLRALGALGDSLGRLAAVANALESLAESAKGLPELPDRVASMEAQVETIGAQLTRLEPALDLLSSSVGSLQDSAQQLSGAVVPLGRVVERLPGGRRSSSS